MKAAPVSLEVPYRDPVVDNKKMIERAWSTFFRDLVSAVFGLGVEKYFEISNNQSVDAKIEGLAFDKAKVGQASVDYLIQRITTSTGATELIETGTFYAAYKPTSDDWVLSDVPSTAGVTLDITADGEVTYTSSNISGTHSISKMTFRARALAAKNSQYSVVG